QLGLGEPVDVHTRWILPGLRDPHPLTDAASDRTFRLIAADFRDRGDAIEGHLATWQESPGALEHRAPDAPPPTAILTALVDTEHAAFLRLAALPIAVAAPLLRHIVCVQLGLPRPMPVRTLKALLEATR
ncbi:MAG: hypothetical protein ACI8RZ_002039, partial [Myxococcota bacterium]